MELTQRLVCTQTINERQTLCPEQVAFLGICGEQYPVIRGPNKIGRDPDTCNIVLKLNSISRHHAVINVLNSSEYMLMDLNSANKTKIGNKTLDPYIPYPLRNGDMVQLGQVFGIFTLLQDNNDLPMTQALDIPDTPVANRHVSKFNIVHITTVPESPDVSDKDDSFIMPSQPKMKEVIKNHINKSSGKTSAPQTGRNKIDNVYWNSSIKSETLNLQSNTTIGSLNSSLTSLKSPESKVNTNNIHELTTQIQNDLVNNEGEDSLFTAETQITEKRQSLNINSMETQTPVDDNLPAVCKIKDQQNVAFDFFTDNKENDIFEAETQVFNIDKPSKPIVKKDNNLESEFKNNSLNTPQDTSDDIIIFDEMESHPIVDVFESQALLSLEDDVAHEVNLLLSKNECETETVTKRNVRLKSDSSTDCEDDIIRLSQNEKRSDDDVTDCEDIPQCQERIQKPDAEDDLTDCEDDLFVKNNLNCDNKIKSHTVKESVNFEDLPTQIVAEHQESRISKDEINFEDMPTQIIVKADIHQNRLETDPNIEDMLTQIVVQNENKQIDKPLQFQTNPSVSMISTNDEKSMTPFKVPQSPLKSKKENKNSLKQQIPVISKSKIDDDCHYASTQEIFDDLCSQKEIYSVVSTSHTPVKESRGSEINKVSFDNKSPINVNEQANEYNSSIQNFSVIDVAKPEKTRSDSSSDVENTPKKVPTITFMETDLPNSQEIKSSVTTRMNMIELSSESETENDSEQFTPILFCRKKKSHDAKIDLSKKFDIDALPTRIITRVRKPTAKLLNTSDNSNKRINNILKPKFLTEQEENIDKEIITENISRLKSKAAKPVIKEKGAKKDETNIDKKRRYKKEAEEKSSIKSKEKKNTERNSKNNKDAPNTIERYLNNTTLDKSVSSSRTTRSRTRKKAEQSVKTDTATSPEIVKSKSNKSDHKKGKKNDVTESIKDQTVRRSRRQNNKDNGVGQRTSKQNEKSTIYNVSSESSLDSSNAMKRSADFQFPSAKKVKTSHGGNTSSTSKYTIDTQYVLFTAFPNEEVKNKLQSLGAVIVTDVMSCTLVLTLQIKRTFKLLCAVGLGRPIVGPAWVQACADANCIVDPHQYILKDEVTEQRFQFDLQKTLRGRRNFLNGYKVSCTPKVIPNPKEMKMIVECSGGTWKEGGKFWLCVSCGADRPLWPQYKRKGATVVSTEVILAGVLRQKLDIQSNKLA